MARWTQISAEVCNTTSLSMGCFNCVCVVMGGGMSFLWMGQNWVWGKAAASGMRFQVLISKAF